MTIGQALAAAAIVVPAFTAFLVAYWHRKQIRQIEAYRQDRTVGLTPPPSPLWTFVTSRWKLLVLAGVPVLLIALYFYLRVPVTLSTVLFIALNVTTIVAAFLLEIIEKMTKVLGGLVELQGTHVQITEKVVSVIRPQGERPSSGA